MTSKAPEAIAILRSVGYDIWDPTDEELDVLSAAIADAVAIGKGWLCINGLPGAPPCRSLQEAISDIRRRAEERT